MSRMMVRQMDVENGAEAERLWHILFRCVHEVNCRDYSARQTRAWAPAKRDMTGWQRRLFRSRPLVLEREANILAFAEMDEVGRLGCFYVDPDWHGLGVGYTLMHQLVALAHKRDIPFLQAEVSITARPFFERQGFIQQHPQQVEREGVVLTNYVMTRDLRNESSIAVLRRAF